MATTQQSGWDSFVSLDWYDATISFLFRFVAKTSEPLLAAGVIVSAADFLQKGQLLAHNPTLASTWAWTQALAIEASTGPVLVFALQALRDKDKVKGVLYAILACLLFVVGSSMLMLQLVSSVTGANEMSIGLPTLLTLFALRVIVSAGMIALSCTKHMRFSGWSETPALATVSPETPSAMMCAIRPTRISRLRLHPSIWQAVHTVTVQEEPLLSLPQHTTVSGGETPDSTPDVPGSDTALEARVAALLALSPDLSSRKVADLVDRPHSTVYRYVAKVKQSMKQPA